MGASPLISRFGSKFWEDKLRELGYPLKVMTLDMPTLREQRAIRSDIEASRVLRLYVDDFVEVALVEFDSDADLRRGLCTRTARSWKENRLIKPLLIFTNGIDSYAVIVPGKGIGGEAKVLGLSDRLYRTDLEVLESMHFPGKAEELSRNYDSVFFPYQKVRDEFFKGYRDLYERVEKAVEKELTGESTSYAQRFLGRLMFLYFLQRKGWLKGNRRFIDTIKDYKELNVLFYESLNREDMPGIPFLNGSLFEREHYMTAQMENRLYSKLDQLFNDARKFFSDYNFTVDETSPLEVEVSIDPALIGTVFENMLPEYERGSKGTFYTPRGESSFICRRALANYLSLEDAISPDGKSFYDGLSKYLEGLAKTKSEKEVREFREKLLSLRTLDPAVGSGGFLLVMMQEIIGLIQEAEAIVGWKSDVELYKKRILPNLYGFDIEPEAIEIARLRLWLSLIIDQKEPEPLPNLDMNLVTIRDSLSLAPQMKLDLYIKYEELRKKAVEVQAKYLNEHDSRVKKTLREEHQKLLRKIEKKTGVDPDVIENAMTVPADIVVMNPPYITQLAIPLQKKEYYVSRYGLDKMTDIYAYFLVRALKLLSEKGVASVITSDKWLETEYGEGLQKKLKDHIVAIYGQKERSFSADINTAIVVFGKERRKTPIYFTYVESYGSKNVRRSVAVQRNILRPGKWFYLRAPTVFVEKILPKLDHRLEEFAIVRRGFTTGANDFFYLKNVTHLYEADRLADPKRFERLRLTASKGSELEKQGLIYVENEIGERFIIEKKDVAPVLRSPTEIISYDIDKLGTWVFKPKPPYEPGKYSKQYIQWGENHKIAIRSGKDAGKEIVGYHRLQTTKHHKPYWYTVSDLDPSRFIHPIGTDKRHFVARCREGCLADQMLVMFNARQKSDETKLWVYMNSIVSFFVFELYGRRFGAGALQVPTGVIKNLPVPNISKLTFSEDVEGLLHREVVLVDEELTKEERKLLDIHVLKALGIRDVITMVHELYDAFSEVVKDRLIKSGDYQEARSINDEGESV
jgi:type I restriction-modification system DNA methylase subunit